MSNLVPWVPLTVEDLLSALTSRERDDLAKVSTDASVPDRAVPILAALTAEIIGYIGSHAGNTLSADPTLIPPEFVAKAMAIARWRLMATLPSGYKADGPRKDEYDKADAFFTSVAKGIIRPRPAPDAVASEVPTEKPYISPKIHGRVRQFGRGQQDGI